MIEFLDFLLDIGERVFMIVWIFALILVALAVLVGGFYLLISGG